MRLTGLLLAASLASTPLPGAADAEGLLNRADFGMTQYAEGEAGKVRLRIQVEALNEG